MPNMDKNMVKFLGVYFVPKSNDDFDKKQLYLKNNTQQNK